MYFIGSLLGLQSMPAYIQQELRDRTSVTFTVCMVGVPFAPIHIYLQRNA